VSTNAIAIAYIPLPTGEWAIIDADNYEDFSRFNWFLNDDGYVVRNLPRKNGKRQRQMMHRRVLWLQDGDPAEGDHIYGDKLDNRRSELRVCTHAENTRNVMKRADNTSGCKGVSYHKASGQWQAKIRYAGKVKYLGLFETPELASEFRNLAADLVHGEFAHHG
jgi:hypothetical protein